MERVAAVIDIGTNSIKFCMGRREGQGKWELLTDTALPARLGEGLYATGRISDAALMRNARAVAECVAEAQKQGATRFRVIGTAAVRAAQNANEFAKLLNYLAGVKLSVLSGEDEAQLSYEAVLNGLETLHDAALVTMDTGGGSTDFVFAERGAIVKRASVPVGAVVLAEHFGLQNAVQPAVLERARGDVLGIFQKAGIAGAAPFFIGIGGSVTALAAAHAQIERYSAAAVHGTVLKRAVVAELMAHFSRMSADERQRFAHLPPGRADIALAGACIVEAAMEALHAETMTVSARGLRHALLARLLRDDEEIAAQGYV